MVRAQRFVVAKTDRDGFVAAVHWHKVDVAVNQQIAFGGAAVKSQGFFVPRLANLDQAFLPFGVVVVITIGIELVIDLLAHHSFHFPRRHLAMEGIRNDDVHVIDTVTREHVQHDFQNRLADVGRGHRRQRKADVVNGDRDLHPGFKLREQWIATQRMIQGITNCCFAIREAFDRRIRIKDARSHRQIFEDEVFAGGHDARRAVAVDVYDRFVRLASKL